MDRRLLAAMTEKIASGDNDEAMNEVDQALDGIIAHITVITTELPKVKPMNPQQQDTLNKVKDLLETGVAPYVADMASLLETFDTPEV